MILHDIGDSVYPKWFKTEPLRPDFSPDTFVIMLKYAQGIGIIKNSEVAIVVSTLL